MSNPRTIVERAIQAHGGPFQSIYRVFCTRMGFEARNLMPLEPGVSKSFVRVILHPGREIRERFSLSGREILLVVSPFATVDHRVVEYAREAIDELAGRVESDFVIIVSADPSAREKVAELTSAYPETFAAFSYAEVEGLGASSTGECMQALESRATAKDLFDIRQAVTNVSQFFGRRDILDEVKRRLAAQGESLGLFGLRKVGKTSFLYQLLARLRNETRVVAAHLDVQLVDAVAPTRSYFLRALGRAILDATPKRVRERLSFSMFGMDQAGASVEQVSERFVEDVSLLLRESNRRVVVVVDEVDLMYPSTASSPWMQHFVPIWRLLRGLAQQHTGDICFFLTGTSPQLIEASTIGTVENPLHQWIEPRYLGPLSRADAAEMLTRIGARVQLEFASDASSFILERTGGHPLLTRMYGSAVFRQLGDRHGAAVVSVDAARGSLPEVQRRAAPVVNQIIESMRDRHPDDFMLLEKLAAGEFDEFTDLATAFPDAITHLLGFGLVEGAQPREMRIALALVEGWMAARAAAAAANRPTPQGHAGVDLTGTNVEGFTLVARAGRPGGFATVYRATSDGSTKQHAVKIYSTATLKQIQRETDCLERVSHRNIVSVYGTGALPDGRPYLVMEFLDGQPLSDYCTPDQALSSAEVLDVASDVLSALVSLHPNQEVVDALLGREELTADEGTALLQARQGYIHRDIKPANLMLVPGRGTVIVDFNVASESGSPAVTTGGTVGYGLPGGAERWGPETDIHALGVTLAEVATGLRLDATRASGLDDLMSAVERKLPFPLRDVLLRMCGRVGERYRTASDALHAVEVARAASQ